MRVAADTHSIYWYLTNHGELSPVALNALNEAEDSEGIVVSSWTVPELWLSSTRKKPGRAVPRNAYEAVRTTLLDDENNIGIAPFDDAMWEHFEVVSMTLPDPFDSAIVATALAFDLEIVTYDDRITASGLVKVIW